MYVRTPKRYRGRQRRSVFSCQRFLLYIVALVIIGLGIFVYRNRGQFIPMVKDTVNDLVHEAEVAMATMSAPTPTPTPDPRNYLTEADIYWQQGSVSEALTLYSEILGAVPNDTQVHSRVTTAYLVQGNYGEAFDHAEMTITANPFSSEAWTLRAWAQRGLGLPEEAVVSALHASELDRENADAYAQLAFAYLDLDQPDRALTTVDRALTIDDRNYSAYRARAYIYWEGLFDFDAAQTDLDLAYSLALEQAPAAGTLLAIDYALLQLRLENTQGAIDALMTLLESSPDNTEALYRLGLIYWGEGEWGQAGNYMTRCIDIDPNSINCNFWLGRAQMRQEQTALADSSFVTAIELGSRNPQHYYWVAVSQQATGNCQQAYQYWQEGYELAQQANQWVEDFEASRPPCAPSERELTLPGTSTPAPPTADPAGSA